MSVQKNDVFAVLLIQQNNIAANSVASGFTVITVFVGVGVFAFLFGSFAEPDCVLFHSGKLGFVPKYSIHFAVLFFAVAASLYSVVFIIRHSRFELFQPNRIHFLRADYVRFYTVHIACKSVAAFCT